ncbi:MAG: ATP synthase F1 subunit gamma [Candidatus Curtissbacteria bacterium]|nr:ATP synthase F1 subunit gamma [Candidatus Curtissbacteria bacterium]
MAQIREIKQRIRSVTNTSKVTHAMELVAAAKMKKSQEAALASRPYTLALNQILAEVRQKAKEASHKLLNNNSAQTELLILITTDRGLVGGLNINLFREVANLNKNAKYIVVGKKGTLFASKSHADIVASFNSDEYSPLDLARTLTKLATESFIKAEVASVKVAYPDFQSTVKQIPTITQVLPIELTEEKKSEGVEADLLFEPNASMILENILPHYVLTKIYQTVLEAKASEHSARMVSMKNATDAAGDLIEDLTLNYNQARQEAITKELLDIITAQGAFQ